MNEITFGLLGLLILLALFLTGIELAFAMAAVGFLGFAFLNGFNVAVSLLAERLPGCPGLLWIDRHPPFRPHGADRF